MSSTVPWMRELPNGRAISALGFGCSSLWAKRNFDENLAQKILAVAVDSGTNHFDTSPSYGSGLGELRLGRFLIGRQEESLVISTKVGNNLIDGTLQRGFNRSLMTISLEGSLARLGRQSIDILYLHGPSVNDLNEETLRFFETEKEAGRIAYSGVETASPAVLERLVDFPVDVVMLHYNIGNMGLSGDVEKLVGSGKTIISGTVLAQSKYDLRTFFPSSRKGLWYLLRILKRDPLFLWRGPAMAWRIRSTGLSPREAAINFITSHPRVLSGLFGSTDPAHVSSNIRIGQQIFDSGDRARLMRAIQCGELRT